MPQIREALCWNFEDDNFTWFDASHDSAVIINEYSPDSYRDALLAIGATGVWVLADTGSTAADETGDFPLPYYGTYLQDQASFIDDQRKATLFQSTGGIWSGSDAGPGGAGPDIVLSLDFAAGVITTVTALPSTIINVQYAFGGTPASVVLKLSATDVRIEITSSDGVLRLSTSHLGVFDSGDVIILDMNLTSAGVYSYFIYKNFAQVATGSGDLLGTYTLASTARLLMGSFPENLTQQYRFYKSGGLAAGDIAALEIAYAKNDQNYPPTITDTKELVPVVCMRYQPDPGWQVRWSDLQSAGTTWAQLASPVTKWSDFSSGPTEQNMYWLTRQGLFLSDQIVRTDGIKEYFVERRLIDLNDVVQEFTSGRWIYAKRIYFHLRSLIQTAAYNPFKIKMGWANTMMDEPNWLAETEINLQDRLAGGKVKYDFRITGRYLSLRMDFSATDAIEMTGAEIDAKQTHGR